MPTVGFRSARAALLATLLLAGCGSTAPTAPASTPSPTGSQPVTPVPAQTRYVALGDSYTIGTSVPDSERWPNQLVARVPELELVANLGVNGFTSRDVIEVELPQLDALFPEFVTVLIGVNDVVQGVPSETYRQNVVAILDDLVDRVGAGRVLVVTTPDYTVTPAGADFGDPAQQAAGIRRNNATITELARALGVGVVDIYEVSLRAGDDPSLVAVDGLHPSGAQYTLWVDRIAPEVATLLGG